MSSREAYVRNGCEASAGTRRRHGLSGGPGVLLALVVPLNCLLLGCMGKRRPSRPQEKLSEAVAGLPRAEATSAAEAGDGLAPMGLRQAEAEPSRTVTAGAELDREGGEDRAFGQKRKEGKRAGLRPPKTAMPAAKPYAPPPPAKSGRLVARTKRLDDGARRVKGRRGRPARMPAPPAPRDSDIPLGGTGVAGELGVGAGASGRLAGPGRRGEPVSRKREAALAQHWAPDSGGMEAPASPPVEVFGDGALEVVGAVAGHQPPRKPAEEVRTRAPVPAEPAPVAVVAAVEHQAPGRPPGPPPPPPPLEPAKPDIVRPDVPDRRSRERAAREGLKRQMLERARKGKAEAERRRRKEAEDARAERDRGPREKFTPAEKLRTGRAAHARDAARTIKEFHGPELPAEEARSRAAPPEEKKTAAEAREAWTALKKKLKGAKARGARIAEMNEALPDFRGTRYERAVEKLIRREKEAMARGKFARLSHKVARSKAPQAKLDQLSTALPTFKGTRYEKKLKSMIESERRTLRAAGGKPVVETARASKRLDDLAREKAEGDVEGQAFLHALKVKEPFAECPEPLANQKRVSIQQSVFDLERAKNAARRDIEVADSLRAGGKADEAARFYEKAKGKYARAAEIVKWMPHQINLSSEAKEIERGLRSAASALGERPSEAIEGLAERWAARLAVEGAAIPYSETLPSGEPDVRGEYERWVRSTGHAGAEQPPSPRQIAAKRLMGIEEKKAPPEQEKRRAPGPQQFVVLSQDEAQVIEKQVQAKLKAEIEAVQRAQMRLPDEPEPVPEAPPEPEPEAARRIPPPPPVNPFVMTAKDRLSTFAMDVDTASYTIARKYIRAGYRPPPGLVRMEEFVNAFDYNYPKRSRDVFDIHSEGMPSPFGKNLQLLKIGIQARIVGREGRKPANLVFVIDTSGSMEQPDRVPLVKYALRLLVGELSPEDLVTVVSYGTRPRLVIEATAASNREDIVGAMNSLQCGGTTNMIAGLRLGYEQAKRRFRAGAVNRVILCSDGVANVGASEAEEILRHIEKYRDWGVTLTVAGFGAGAYDDRLLEKLANSGDGHYIFVDSRREARRVFVEELGATLHTVAKDAKIQVEFDPRRARRYRLVGYENRDIADEKFRDDTVDAGEVGSGQSVTALYELELHEIGLVEPGRSPAAQAASEEAGDVGTVYVRYRNIATGEIEEISHRLRREAVAAGRRPKVEEAPRLYLAACVAEFAEILRGSEHARGGDLAAVERKLDAVVKVLPLDKRVRELVWLVRRAKGLPRAQ